MDNKRLLTLLAILLALWVTLLVLMSVPDAQATTANTAFVTLQNRNGVLNVRTAPIDGEIVGFLSDGRDVVVVDTLDGWALVSNPDDYGDPLGWVCMDYIHVYGGDITYEANQVSQPENHG